MIKPLNKFVQIEPEAHDEFVTSQRSTYDEIGIVIEIDDDLSVPIKKGSRVFFDSWMAAKFPKGDGTYYWLVPYENIKAYEDGQIPKE